MRPRPGGGAARASTTAIVEGYHLNKRHWITITLDADVPDERVRQLVSDSYDLVKPQLALGEAPERGQTSGSVTPPSTRIVWPVT